jgi:hypothetical protein
VYEDGTVAFLANLLGACCYEQEDNPDLTRAHFHTPEQVHVLTMPPLRADPAPANQLLLLGIIRLLLQALAAELYCGIYTLSGREVAVGVILALVVT